MNNPYKPPVADMDEAGSTVSVNKIWWKIVLFVFVPLEIWGEYESFAVNEYDQSLIWRVVSLLIYLVFYVALVGLAFDKKILSSTFWVSFLPVIILNDIGELYLVFSVFNEELIATIVTIAVVFPILIIPWYAVYKYHRVLKFYR
ncbi:MAG: hypothetical protein KUG73_04090 [Pseudomonadales bacterium]|nr:hypothetical protein [Pseudomonadales bacterium]